LFYYHDAGKALNQSCFSVMMLKDSKINVVLVSDACKDQPWMAKYHTAHNRLGALTQ
jgi:hypothetical protein